MISLEQFANRVFNKFDSIEGKIDDLCNRQTVLEGKFDTHLEVKEALEKQDERQKEDKNRRFYVLMAILGFCFTAYVAIKELI